MSIEEIEQSIQEQRAEILELKRQLAEKRKIVEELDLRRRNNSLYDAQNVLRENKLIKITFQTPIDDTYVFCIVSDWRVTSENDIEIYGVTIDEPSTDIISNIIRGRAVYDVRQTTKFEPATSDEIKHLMKNSERRVLQLLEDNGIS